MRVFRAQQQQKRALFTIYHLHFSHPGSLPSAPFLTSICFHLSIYHFRVRSHYNAYEHVHKMRLLFRKKRRKTTTTPSTEANKPVKHIHTCKQGKNQLCFKIDNEEWINHLSAEFSHSRIPCVALWICFVTHPCVLPPFTSHVVLDDCFRRVQYTMYVLCAYIGTISLFAYSLPFVYAKKTVPWILKTKHQQQQRSLSNEFACFLEGCFHRESWTNIDF